MTWENRYFVRDFTTEIPPREVVDIITNCVNYIPSQVADNDHFWVLLEPEHKHIKQWLVDNVHYHNIEENGEIEEEHFAHLIDAPYVLHCAYNTVTKTEKELRKIRWKGISIVFQGAMNAWNPVVKIGEQIREAIREHYPNNSKEENSDKIKKLFDIVGLDHSIMNRFPHELSGGMKQRAVIALSLSCDPKLVIADEPTTALDVVIQDQILNEIKKVQELLGLSLIYISHDIAVIAEMTDKMAVMYAGSIVEKGPTSEIFANPQHSYTKSLLASTPSVVGDKVKLNSLDGEPPSLIDQIKGCSFAPRCPNRNTTCHPELDMELVEVGPDHYVDICSASRN